MAIGATTPGRIDTQISNKFFDYSNCMIFWKYYNFIEKRKETEDSFTSHS